VIFGRTRLLGVVVAALTLACAAQPCPSGLPDRGQSAGLEGNLNGMRWLGAAAKRARRAGARQVQVLTTEAAGPGDRLERMLGVADDLCVLLLARASESVQDVDLFAYGEDGRVWGADKAPDKTPGLLICPPHPRRLYVMARVITGHGLVALGALEVEPSRARPVAAALEIRSGSTGDATRFEAWPGLDEKLQARRRQLGSSWQDVRRVAVPVTPTAPTLVSASVEANQCLDVLVLPSEEVAHLDVSVVDREGRVVGRAGASGPDRALLLCSATTTPVSVEVRPHSGEGLVAVALSRSVDGGPDEFADRTLVHDLAPTRPLAEVREQHANKLARVGYAAGKDVGRGDLAIGRRRSVTVSLPSGCSRLDVLGGHPIRGLESWLWSPAGKLVAHDSGTASARLFGCGPAGDYRLDAEALALAGPFVVELRPEAGTPKLLDRHPLAASRLLHRMISRGVITRAAQVGAARSFSLAPTGVQRMEYRVPVGRCVDFTLALDAGARGAEIRLSNVDAGARGAEIRLSNVANGLELALSRGNHSTSARACALRSSGTLKVRAELRTQYGDAQGLVATRLLSPRR
jgi:hypothetical protein